MNGIEEKSSFIGVLAIRLLDPSGSASSDAYWLQSESTACLRVTHGSVSITLGRKLLFELNEDANYLNFRFKLLKREHTQKLWILLIYNVNKILQIYFNIN